VTALNAFEEPPERSVRARAGDSPSAKRRVRGTIERMGGTETPSATLDEARAAVAERSWERAHELFAAVAAERPLEAEDLERFAKAAFWIGAADGAISIRESAYEAFLARGDNARAALCALTLQRQHAAMLQDSVAAAWLTQAEWLLAGAPESAAHGYLAIAHADSARARGDTVAALAQVERARDLADRSTDRNLPAWARMRRGMFLVDSGRVDEGRPLLEEVAAAAAGGELGTFTTGAVLSNVVSIYRDLGDYRRGGAWSNTAMRWSERQRLTGFPGIARVNRSAILRMLGQLRQAEEEARAAWRELRDFSPAYAAAAQHEVGEAHLRLGDLAAADEAFRQARELGEDPQPGLALLQLAQGDLDVAASSIRRSLEVAAFDRFARARMLPAQAEIAKAAGDAQTARAARDELAEIADQIGSPAIRAAREWTTGITAHLEEDHVLATEHLAKARKLWDEVGASYESATVALALAEVQLAGGNDEAAAAELNAARAAFERLGAHRDARRAEELRARATGHVGASARAERTFLFTDIVGSTALIEVIGDEAWNDLRRWHNETLRSSFDHHDGEEIDHAGDGFFVAFRDAERGVACAVQIQRRLAEHRRSHGFAPQVRMGLHATTATRDESGYTGLGVHTASRIGSLAGAGEILASAETLAGAPDARASEQRTVQLKGIVDPVDVVSIEWQPSSTG
jgi:class 3 adenylate cyclase